MKTKNKYNLIDFVLHIRYAMFIIVLTIMFTQFYIDLTAYKFSLNSYNIQLYNIEIYNF